MCFFQSFINIIDKDTHLASATVPLCHGIGCFFTPPQKSGYIFDTPLQKVSEPSPKVTLVDFSPNGRVLKGKLS